MPQMFSKQMFQSMLIFITDSKKQLIGVCTIRGFFCQGVITTGVTNPRGIAVQPNHGKLKIPVKPRMYFFLK